MIETQRKAWKERQGGKKEKPMFLKDYHRNILLNGETPNKEFVITHAEEQEKLKQDFKIALVEDSDSGDELFQKRKSDEISVDDDEEYRQFILENMGDSDEKIDYNQDQGEKFLYDFVLNKGWVDKDLESNKLPTYSEIVDEDEVERVDEAEDYERRHNFRYEEDGGANITTYSRNIENSSRRVDDRRKKERSSRKEKKDEIATKKLEDLKRLKNLKRLEILEKLKKVHTISGVELNANEYETNESYNGMFNAEDFDDDFDGETYDSKMKQVFNDDYYGSEERIKPVKPIFGDDIDISNLLEPDNEDFSIIDRIKVKDESFSMDADYLEGGDQFGMDLKVKKSKRDKKKGKKKKKLSVDQEEEEKNTTQELGTSSLDSVYDELYQMDYEDMV